MKPFVFSILLISIISCTQESELTYKYSDKEQIITCTDQNNTLLNEALYSFEQDLLDYSKAETKTLVSSYGQYLYKGMEGTALYKDIANEHSLAIRDALLKEDILVTNGVKSNLNYNHPAVQCVLNNIESNGIKKTISSLIEVGGMNPALFNSRLRNFGPQAQKSRNQALYIALDSYYQNLVGITLDAPVVNE